MLCLKIKAFILDKSPLKLIIGLQSIRQLNLFNLFPEHVGLIRQPTSSLHASPETIKMCMPCGCQPSEEFATSFGTKKVKWLTQTILPTTAKTHVNASLILESEQLLGHIGPDGDEIEDHLNDSFSPWLDRFSSEDPLSLIHISGDEKKK